jgi:hypothetical protein
MNNSMQYSALTRLLNLNNRTYDLENLLRGLVVPMSESSADIPLNMNIPHPIADLQDEVDQLVRTSLVTCWLGMPDVDND